MDHLMGRKQYRAVGDAEGNPICKVKILDTSKHSGNLEWPKNL